MKRLAAANDNGMCDQVARTKQIWQPRIAHNVTDEDARRFVHCVTGFFCLLAEWSRAEKLAAANDTGTPAKPSGADANHGR